MIGTDSHVVLSMRPVLFLKRLHRNGVDAAHPQSCTHLPRRPRLRSAIPSQPPSPPSVIYTMQFRKRIEPVVSPPYYFNCIQYGSGFTSPFRNTEVRARFGAWCSKGWCELAPLLAVQGDSGVRTLVLGRSGSRTEGGGMYGCGGDRCRILRMRNVFGICLFHPN